MGAGRGRADRLPGRHIVAAAEIPGILARTGVEPRAWMGFHARRRAPVRDRATRKGARPDPQCGVFVYRRLRAGFLTLRLHRRGRSHGELFPAGRRRPRRPYKSCVHVIVTAWPCPPRPPGMPRARQSPIRCRAEAHPPSILPGDRRPMDTDPADPRGPATNSLAGPYGSARPRKPNLIFFCS